MTRAADLNAMPRPKSAASKLAAEGSFALGVGDTLLAAEKYAAAGEVLQHAAEAELKAPERNLLRFLAASQYFHGGHYRRAAKLAGRIEERRLPASVRPLFGPFRRDAERRAEPGYKAELAISFMAMAKGGLEPTDALELLKSHPFVFDRATLATARAVLCEALGDYRAAALFHASAMKFQPDDPQLILLSISIPLDLTNRSRLDEAWEYVQKLLVINPHPVVEICASLLCFRRWARLPQGEARTQVMQEQIALMERAWGGYQRLPETFRFDPAIRKYMVHSFQLALMTLWEQGDKVRFREVGDVAINFDPAASTFWMIRGAAAYPGAEAIADLKRAVELRAPQHYAYYYLAHDAFDRGVSKDAKAWIEQALARNPPPAIRGQLYGWLACCLSVEQGAPPEEVERLFAQARELAPDLVEIVENYTKFHRAVNNRPKPVTRLANVFEGYSGEFPSPSNVGPKQESRWDAVFNRPTQQAAVVTA